MKEKLKKIFSWINNHKTPSLLTILLITLSIISVIIPEEPMDSVLTPTPTPSSQALTLTKVKPQSGEFKSVFGIEKITFTFSKNIDINTFKYQITPVIKTRITTEEGPRNTITILPLEGWKENVNYQIVIFDGLTALDGNKLNQSILYEIKRLVPQPGDPEYPYIESEEDFHETYSIP